MSINILALEGDGIGPEIMEATLDVVSFFKSRITARYSIYKGACRTKITQKT